MPTARLSIPGLLLAAAALSTPAFAVPSTTVTVSRQVGTPTVVTYDRLPALAQTTSTQTYTAAGKPVTDTFTGPTLSAVLAAVGAVKLLGH